MKTSLYLVTFFCMVVSLSARSTPDSVFAWVLKEHPKAELFIFGSVTDDPRVGLYVPEYLWKSFDEEQRAALNQYMQREMKEIVPSPGPYTGIPRSAPAYKFAYNNCRDNLAVDDWFIGVGKFDLNGEFIYLKEVVEG